MLRAPLLTLLLLLRGGGFSAPAQTDRMTLKTFATAAGRLEAIDVPNREIVWRFENDLEMRFPFADVRFILCGGERFARIRTEQDSLPVEGLLTGFTPDAGLKIRLPGGKNLQRIVTRYRSIDFAIAPRDSLLPGGR